MKTIKEKWINLSLHEKRIVTSSIFIAVILFFYALVASPLADKLKNLHKQIAQSNQLLAWMQMADDRIKSLQQNLQSSSATSAKSILSTIQTEIKQASLEKNLVTLRQADDQAVQVNLQNVSFDQLITWLIQLSRKYSYQVSQMTVTSTTIQGMVNIEMVVSM